MALDAITTNKFGYFLLRVKFVAVCVGGVYKKIFML